MASSSAPEATYGFIGLGNMGWGMARNLRAKIAKESTVVICEIDENRRGRFISETGGLIREAGCPREVAEQADIIITMLPRGEHVHDVFTHASTGLLSASPSTDSRPKLFIECSTIDVKTSLAVGRAVHASGLGVMVDAPVSGGPNGATAGTLTFMVGGAAELFERVRGVVRLMGKEESIFHCGDAGAGLATKQINNYLSAVSILGVCEAMNMGVRYGLDPKTLAGVINVSSGQCYNSLDQNPVKGVTATAAAAKDFEGGFSTELCKGVVDMAVGLGKEVGAKSVLANIVQDVFERAVNSEKCKGKDSRSVYRLFAEEEGRALD